MLIVFLLSGLWHGANWTFVIWGALNGIYLIASVWTENARAKLVELSGLSKYPETHKLIKMLITFCLVCFAWIFFRANSLKDALFISGHLFNGFTNIFNLSRLKTTLPVDNLAAMNCFAAIFAILAIEYIAQRHSTAVRALFKKSAFLRWGSYYALIAGIMLFGLFNRSQFIYFQF